MIYSTPFSVESCAMFFLSPFYSIPGLAGLAERQRRDELTQKWLVCLHNIHKHNVVHAPSQMNGLAFGFNIFSA